jgi:hypothetical protein
MKGPEEASVLDFLQHVPSLSRQGRIYVGSNGHLVLDAVYDYTGALGRRCLDLVVGGYNRGTIIDALDGHLEKVMLLATRCITKLNNPYVQGNKKMFNIRTIETTHYEHCTVCITHGLGRIQSLLDVLLATYHNDANTCSCVRRTMSKAEEINWLLRPVLTGIV